MRNILLYSGILFCMQGQLAAQESCITEKYFLEQAAKDPSLLLKRNVYHQKVRDWTAGQNARSAKTTAAVRVIPVVFHVIHQWGTENISREALLEQLAVLNESFSKKNARLSSVPAAFKDKIADCNIEFRLARRDPDGNCTDGILRIESDLTVNANDDVKALSWWNNERYLNVWTVKSIDGSRWQGTGEILGYAQFPYYGSSTTDGIVMKAAYVGRVDEGRVLAHEVGHWLGLRHVWGDSDCGNDEVSDTPVQKQANYDCPSYPHVTCSNGPNGDMFVNFMDYTNCSSMFSLGQKSVMDATLAGTRATLVSETNNTTTGTADTVAIAECIPVSDFGADYTAICAGDSVQFQDRSWKGKADRWSWSFEGGSPSVSDQQNPVVVYNNSGEFDVQFAAGNSSGSNGIVKSRLISVGSTEVLYAVPYSESFEEPGKRETDWLIQNNNNFPASWQPSINASHTGWYSMLVQNYNRPPGAGSTELISPTIDLSAYQIPMLNFSFAYAQTDPDLPEAARLRVFASDNCGKYWSPRFSKSDDNLSTTNTTQGFYSPFIPAANQWRTETVSLLPVTGSKNVRLKFEFSSAGGNNLYLDDINITEASAVSTETDEPLNFTIQQNAGGILLLTFEIQKRDQPVLAIYDLAGRRLMEKRFPDLEKGPHRLQVEGPNTSGLYLIRLNYASGFVYKKLFVGSSQP